VRYLVVETGASSVGSVLISPISFRQADWSTRPLSPGADEDKVKSSPSVDVEQARLAAARA